MDNDVTIITPLGGSDLDKKSLGPLLQKYLKPVS